MVEKDAEREKLLMLLDYWIEHNGEHEHEYKEWIQKIDGMGYKEVTGLLSEVVELTEAIQHHFNNARNILEKPVHVGEMKEKDIKEIKPEHEHVTLHTIGVIHTPYVEKIPENAEEKNGEFIIEIYQPYNNKLNDLKPGTRVLVVYAFESPRSHISAEKEHSYLSHNSSHDLNPVDVAIVKIQKSEENRIKINPITVKDGARILFLREERS